LSGVPVKRAIERLLRNVTVLPAEEAPLSNACGRVLAETVGAAEPLPPFTRALADGYAVRSRNLRGASAASPVPLRISGSALAGHPTNKALSQGEAIEVTTGTLLPAKADAVLRQEYAETRGDTVLARRPVAKGEDVARVGSELRQGEVVARAGYLLEPVGIGVLASMGVRSVLVRRKPRVGVISCGDELVSLGSRLGAGAIRDSNRMLLGCIVSRNGASEVTSIRARDTERDVAKNVKRLLHMDLLVVTGGSGPGRADLVKQSLLRQGMRMKFDGVLMRPGHTCAFGILDGVPILMLPGTPPAVFVCGEVLLGRALRKMSGRRDIERPTVRARLVAPVKGHPVEDRYYTACVTRKNRGYHVAPVRTMRSLRGVHTINGILVVQAGKEQIPEGSMADVEMIEL